ncbi:AAA family ATPase [Fusarium pseudoanthophilum]|uniref:AAA family ATPase n=1 Tax=Fusarium pseudoanthophilum TaxID=48495 RepID=A0A8H5P528_9HYPO|nr:AAA family ATPase [Fusarium pseudoanthophilum]
MAPCPAQSKPSLLSRISAVEEKLAELETRLVPPSTEPDVNGRHEAEDVSENRNGNGEEEEKTTSRVKIVIIKTNPETGESMEVDRAPKAIQSKEPEESNHAFILRKLVYDAKDPAQNHSEIIITDTDLWELLKKKLGHTPYHLFRGSPVTLFSPFQAIVFQFDELIKESQEAREGEADERTWKDLRLLLDTISSGSSGDERLDKYFKVRPSYRSREPETIQFKDLWTIFPPGTLVYGEPFQNQPQVFIVMTNSRPWPWQRDDDSRNSTRLAPWYLHAWSYDWRDGTFCRCLFLLKFHPFDGHLPLTTLPYYPFKLHTDYHNVRQDLIRRGKEFRKICEAKQSSRLYEYKGKAIFERAGLSSIRNDDETAFDFISDDQGKTQGTCLTTSGVSNCQKVAGRVMVDFESYFQYAESEARNGTLIPSGGIECLCSDCQLNTGLRARSRSHFDDAEFISRKEWDDEQYLICSPRVLGYILKEKQWAQLLVSNLKYIPQQDREDLLGRLKLADDEAPKTRKGNGGTKKLLLDLVTSHTSAKTQRDDEDEQDLDIDDIIPDKGKGLIILLYGPPGVGKTSTAETVAMVTGKALFSVSVSDVGTQAKHVESNLGRIFALATKWQVILLLDEADVFLESRERGNKVLSTDKNALVSVFLRVLEYYQGIMFLTTNQIAEFDVAIPSRIHLAIRYESLQTSQMEAIFDSFLRDLDERNLIEDYSDIKDWLDDSVYKEKLDGHQIRNMITTALGLARAEARSGGGQKLNKRHLKRAFGNISDFKRDFNTQMQRYIDGQEKMIK